MNWLIATGGILVGLFLSGFFSGSETGLYRVNRLRLHLAVKQRDPRALRVSRLLDDEQGALSMVLVGTNLANYIVTSAAAYLFAEHLRVAESQAELYTVLILTPIVFVFGEVVPKNLYRVHADALLARGSWLLLAFDRLCRALGFVWVLTTLSATLNRVLLPDPDAGTGLAPKRRVAMLLQEALAANTLGEDQSVLIDRVCRMSETPVHVIMVPLNRVVTISARADRKELIRIARRRGHPRLPVYEHHPRHVIGIINVDDLLLNEEWTTVADRLLPALRLSPHDTVATALTELQRAGRSLAVVTDHGGRTLGIVTVKDLLGEVVGEMAAAV